MNTNYYQMQHFITESNWSARELMDQTTRDVSLTLPKKKLTALIIDESGWSKKRNKSVGVGKQYCGNLGKVDNCQVAVFASLSNGDYSSLIDARLYLPENWSNDPERCDQAGIPESERAFKTKAQLTWEIISHQAWQINFDFVSGDGFYGNDAELDRRIDEEGHLYMLDILAIRPFTSPAPSCTSYHAKAPGAGLHTGRAFFCGVQYQGIKTDIGVGPVTNPQMECMAAPSGIDSGFFFHTERENTQ